MFILAECRQVLTLLSFVPGEVLSILSPCYRSYLHWTTVRRISCDVLRPWELQEPSWLTSQH